MSIEAIYFLHAYSPLHNGAGTGQVGLIDRPIIRERITGLPFHQATGIKGSLRDAVGMTPRQKSIAFGDETPSGSTNNGYLDFDDAMLLALPVRSLKGGLAWLTSPLLLARFQRAVRAASPTDFSTLAQLISGSIPDGTVKLTATGVADLSVVAAGVNYIFLEEYRINTTVEVVNGPLAQFSESLATVALGNTSGTNEDAMAIAFSRRLLLGHNDLLLYFAKHATEVQANIKIEDATGVTKGGSLRYTEYLPSESILFGRITAQKPGFGAPGAQAATMTAIYADEAAMLADFTNSANGRVFTFGADRSTGKGLCRFALMHRHVPARGV
jgi:CRISPR-associated protein Cmr4